MHGKRAARGEPGQPFLQNWNAVHPRRAGFPAAHPAVRLVLLSSEPDTVHGAALHGTRALGNSVLRPSTANCRRKMSTQIVYRKPEKNASLFFSFAGNGLEKGYRKHALCAMRAQLPLFCSCPSEKRGSVNPSSRRGRGCGRRPRGARGGRTRAPARRRGGR